MLRSQGEEPRSTGPREMQLSEEVLIRTEQYYINGKYIKLWVLDLSMPRAWHIECLAG